MAPVMSDIIWDNMMNDDNVSSAKSWILLAILFIVCVIFITPSFLVDHLKPIIEVIEVCNENNWQEREIYWISYYKERVDLCNHHEGGLGCLGRKLTQNEKEKIRKIGYKQSYFSEEEKGGDSMGRIKEEKSNESMKSEEESNTT